MAFSITLVTNENFITRRFFLKVSYVCLHALEKRIMDMIRVLYMNPSKCFNRKNGKNCSHNIIRDIHKKYIRNKDLIKNIEDYLFI